MRRRRSMFTLLTVVSSLAASNTAGQAPIPPPVSQSQQDLNTTLMQSTFMIQGKTVDGNIAYGTGFVVGRPLKRDPTKGVAVLVTARHVLEFISGRYAELDYRARDRQGAWRREPVPIEIRSASNAPLWTSHPSADIVAMYVKLPEDSADLALVSINLLADDAILSQYDIHPGDQVYSLGYPLQTESSDAGFPVLRSGTIASYPLLPTERTKSFLMDFPVFPGNSGGPVYIVSENRVYAGVTHTGIFHAILGIVIEEKYANERIPDRAGGVTERKLFVNLAEVVHASLIREVINRLPELPGQ
jgi:S1-C subfamily serine protease